MKKGIIFKFERILLTVGEKMETVDVDVIKGPSG